jgi:hypothetical protein
VTGQDTLAEVVSREAEKLNTLSEGTAPLEPDQLERLEVLCRCAKLLRVPAAEPKAGDDGEHSTADDLKAVGG